MPDQALQRTVAGVGGLFCGYVLSRQLLPLSLQQSRDLRTVLEIDKSSTLESAPPR